MCTIKLKCISSEKQIKKAKSEGMCVYVCICVWNKQQTVYGDTVWCSQCQCQAYMSVSLINVSMSFSNTTAAVATKPSQKQNRHLLLNLASQETKTLSTKLNLIGQSNQLVLYIINANKII